LTTYRRLFDSVLTHIDAERAHRIGFAAVRAGGPMLRDRIVPDHPALSVEALGLRFRSPLGLAAGFDKNAVGIGALAALGFGFIEVGTVTGQAQPGNLRPRLFRLPADDAIVNRMGFNNDGAEVVARRLARRLARREVRGRGRSWAGRRPDVVLGINIGRSKEVPDADAIADYESSTRLLAPYADYLVVNVSSPNTPGLRDLQAVELLRPLLEAVRSEADRATPDRRVPLLVKIAPDLADDDVVAVADLALELGLDGIVATNTTISHDGLRSRPADVAAVGAGGLSGRPLRERSFAVLELLRKRSGDELTLISVGGVSTARDIRERMRAGASLVQAYTAFVYQGPLWPSRVQRELAALLTGES
jgi:dihydroorotate dehydrogenase